MVKSLYFRLFYRVILVAVAAGATVLTLYGRNYRTLIYYTTWSVWLCSLTSLSALSETARAFSGGERNGKAFYALKFAATVTIAVTFFMSAFTLPHKIWSAGYWTAGSTFKHFLLPVLAVVDELLFAERGSYKPYYALVALLPSLIYWTAIIARIYIARSLFGGAIRGVRGFYYYPYPFTYIDGGVSVGFLITLLALIGACMLLISAVSILINGKKRTPH